MDDLSPGTLLISAPMLEDPNFRRQVILVCEHAPAEGTFGLTLSRRLDVTLGDVMDGYYAYDPGLFLGGPVQHDTLHFLHRRDDVPDGIPVSDNLTWGGSFDAVQELAQRGDLTDDEIRFFLGYAGWSPGQLQGELDEDAWIVVPDAAHVVFGEDPNALWRTVLRQMGGHYAMLSNFPDDPRMN